MKKGAVMKVTTALGLLSLVPLTVWANGDFRKAGPPQGLVTEMIVACDGRQAGDSVTMALGQGKSVEASCQDYGGELLAIPNQLLKRDHRGKSYPLIGTGQAGCYDDSGAEISCPERGEAFFGQDAQFSGKEFSFTDNGDSTVSDNNTGLLWQQTPAETAYSWADAQNYCASLSLADSDDWRTPSLKELFSISDFTTGWPFIDTEYFVLANTPEFKAQQYWSSNYYEVGTTHGGAPSAIGVNHATGHIKAYPDGRDDQPMAAKYVRCVQGDTYGVNTFIDNDNGTITDAATGLMWAQEDSYVGLNWQEALAFAEQKNAENYLGYHNWRVPNVKELQSIVDYSGVYPAIDENYFNITDEDAYFWSSTSAYFSPQAPGYYYAWYVAFGYAVGPEGDDVHGAGAVRFDTKVQGGPAGEEPERIYNYVRLVRDAGKHTQKAKAGMRQKQQNH